MTNGSSGSNFYTGGLRNYLFKKFWNRNSFIIYIIKDTGSLCKETFPRNDFLNFIFFSINSTNVLVPFRSKFGSYE